MYYVVYAFLWLFSLLPLRVLYVFSDGIYALVFYIIKYRRDVVMHNLETVFPELTEKERKKIARRFYHNFIDTFIETIKMISAGRKFIEKRVQGNWEEINRVKPTGKSVQIHIGHNFNWEWVNATGARSMNMPFLGVYMPIANKIFERMFYKLRSRYGTILLRATHMQEDFAPYRNTQYVLGLAADQNPGVPAKAWWFRFFNRPTPFARGPAKNAVLNKTAVVFAFIHKPARGRYEVVFEEVPGIEQKDELGLTREFVRYLEGVIRKYPDMWLWSHRRWKHAYKEEYGPVHE